MTLSLKKFVSSSNVSPVIHPRQLELATYWVSTNYVAIDANMFLITFSTLGLVSKKIETCFYLCTVVNSYFVHIYFQFVTQASVFFFICAEMEM